MKKHKQLKRWNTARHQCSKDKKPLINWAKSLKLLKVITCFSYTAFPEEDCVAETQIYYIDIILQQVLLSNAKSTSFLLIVSIVFSTSSTMEICCLLHMKCGLTCWITVVRKHLTMWAFTLCSNVVKCVWPSLNVVQSGQFQNMLSTCVNTYYWRFSTA